jgi:PKD repeat protein
MKTIARLSLVLAVLCGARGASATPVESVAYQNCWTDYWTPYPLSCDLYLAGPNGGGGLLQPNAVDPAWSPDGSKIGFTRFNDGVRSAIAVFDVVAATTTEVVASGAVPAWSPDGTKIAFMGGPTGVGLAVVNADGTGEVSLTNDGYVTGRPSWSPDGARIAYNCLTPSGHQAICSIAVDGSDVVQLTDSADDFHPAYSPDGTRIAYATWGPGYDIAVMTSAGEGQHVLGLGGYGPAWSPDGARIVFTAPFGGVCEDDGQSCADWLFSANADGTDVVFLRTGSMPSVTGNAQLLRPIVRFQQYCQGGGTCDFQGDAWDLNGTIIAYAWDFGDGTTASGPNARHTYPSYGTYPVTLTVTDDEGMTRTASDTVLYWAAPVAVISYACTQLQCSFDGRGSHDADGTIVSYDWYFSDGVWASGPTAVHTFPGTGNYYAYLRVTDDNGLMGAEYVAFFVTVPTPPVAAFTATCTEALCAFNAGGSYDPNGSIVAYAWTFGDGTTGTGVTASHAYPASGTYTASLRVTDNEGLTNTVTRPVTVTILATHVGDLDGATTGSGNSWTATVNVAAHATGEALQSSATVTGTWSVGGSSSCTTNATGRCAVSKASIPNKTRNVTFTVTGVTHPTRAYNASANHDPDGDSNGTAITVTR